MTARRMTQRTSEWVATVTLVAVAVNATASILLWWTTSSYTELTAKLVAGHPYVAPDSITIQMNPKGMHAELEIRNFGNGAAFEVVITTEPQLNGQPLDTKQVPKKSGAVYPPQSKNRRGLVDIPRAILEDLEAGRSTYRVLVDIQYESATHAKYHHHVTYELPQGGGFFRLYEEWCKDEYGRRCGPEE